MARPLQILGIILLLSGSPGCQGDNGLAPMRGDLARSGAGEDGGGADPQTPPTGSTADLMAWLSAGSYKSWHCEAMQHPPGPHGAHGSNRICSNHLISGAPDTGEYPMGSASVKELYSGASVAGYAVSVHIKTGQSGSAWYWYENGSGGIGVGLCAGCHAMAGSGGDWSGHDFVFVRVK